MARQINRSLLLITICSTIGVLLGGTTGWADSINCLQAEQPTNQCLTQDPVIKTIEGMGTGLLAGAGAALGAVWQIKRQDS